MPNKKRAKKTYGPYHAKVDEICDGDTVYMTIDLGFGHQIASHDLDDEPWLSCRVYGIDAPKLPTPEGVAALAYAKELLPVGTFVVVISHGWDKYGGRFDGSITLPNGGDFTAAMLAAGHGKPYFGGPK